MPPDLTPERVDKLVKLWTGRLAEADKSSADSSLKQKFRNQTEELIREIKKVNDPRDVNVWIESVASKLKDLAPHLAGVLKLTAEQAVKGACRYRIQGKDVCIVVTKFDCEGLGEFEPGGGCP